MTTVYEAIMLAADHIERNPDRFCFLTNSTPKGRGCGSSGCAIGWIIHFMGETHSGFDRVAREHLRVKEQFEFYVKMSELESRWKESAAACAIALRKYADKYLSHQKPKAEPRDLIPAGVREIFSRTYTAKDLTV